MLYMATGISSPRSQALERQHRRPQQLQDQHDSARFPPAPLRNGVAEQQMMEDHALARDPDIQNVPPAPDSSAPSHRSPCLQTHQCSPADQRRRWVTADAPCLLGPAPVGRARSIAGCVQGLLMRTQEWPARVLQLAMPNCPKKRVHATHVVWVPVARHLWPS